MKTTRFFCLAMLLAALNSLHCSLERIDLVIHTFQKTVDLKGVFIEDVYGIYQRSDGKYAVLVKVAGLLGIPASGLLDEQGDLIGALTPHPSIDGHVSDAIPDGQNGFIIIGYTWSNESPYVARISGDQQVLFFQNIPKYESTAVGYDVRAVALSQTNGIGMVGIYHKFNFTMIGTGFGRYNTDGAGVPSTSYTEYDNVVPYDIETTREGDYIVVGNSGTRGYIKFFYDAGGQFDQHSYNDRKFFDIQRTGANNYVLLCSAPDASLRLRGVDLDLNIMWDAKGSEYVGNGQTIGLIKSRQNEKVLLCLQASEGYTLLCISAADGKEIWRSPHLFTTPGGDLYARQMDFTLDKGTISASVVSDSLYVVKTDAMGNVF